MQCKSHSSKQRKEDRGKRTLDLSDVLEIRKKSASLESPKLQEEIAKTKGWTLEGGVDEFSYEELMEIIGKLDKKLKAVENIIDCKKGETNKMNERTVHDSHMKGLSTIQRLNIYVPMDYSRRTLEGGVDEFSFEELMENIGKLDNKLEEVDNIIDLKKGKTNSMNEHIVHYSHMKGFLQFNHLISMCPWIMHGRNEIQRWDIRLKLHHWISFHTKVKTRYLPLEKFAGKK